MISVLYVDDESDLCELGKLFLEQSGEMSVDTCTSAKEALASPAFSSYDAIISDYLMPEMDGIEFLQVVRADHGSLPFILFTGRGREEVVIAAINHGVDFYLQKGGDPASQFAELAHKVRVAVERRRAEEALAESEQRFNDIINFLPDATFAVDRSGTVIAWNRAIEEMTGVPAGEMLKKSDHEYGLPFYGEKRPILIDLVFHDDEEVRRKYPFVTRKEDKFISEIFIPRLYGGKGAYLWFIASPLYDMHGNVVGAIESIRDITDRKQVEDALSESEQRLNDIINFLPDATLAVDRSGTVIAWNRAIEEMTGVPAGEMLGKGNYEYAVPFYGVRRKMFLDLIISRDEPVLKNYAHVQQEGDTLIAETTLALQKGRPVTIMVKASPLYNRQGEVVGAIESMRDITAQKKAEAELSESEQRLNDIINFLPDATFAIDRSGTVIAWNQAIEEMTGTPAAEMLGKNNREYAVPFYGIRRKILIDLVFEPDDVIAANYAQIIHEGDRLIAETPLPRPGGREVILMGTASPLYNRQGEVVGAIESIRDITRLRQAEEDVLHARKDWEIIFRAIGHPAIIMDHEGRIIDANDAALLATKMTIDEIKNRQCFEVFTPRRTGQLPVNCPLETVKRSKEPVTVEEDMEILGGVYHVSCTPVFTAEGQLEKVILIAMDITEQQKTRDEIKAAYEQITASEEELRDQFDTLAENERRIRESEAKYRELADMLPQVVFEMGIDLKITYANAYALATFGMGGEELPAGMDALAAIHPADHARIKSNIEKLVRGDPFDDHEYTAIRQDGSTFPVAVYSVPIRRSGQVCGFRGIMVDISERKKAEDAVRESEEKFRTLFNNASDAIYIHGLMPDGAPGQFIEVNEIMCQRLGYTRDELRMMTVRDIVSDAHRKKMGAIRNEIATTGHFTFLAEHQRKDGTVFPVEVNSRRFILKDKPVVLAVARDITERTELESEIRQQHRQLKNIMEILPAGVFRATASQSPKWVMANPILAQIFGYDSPGGFLDRPPLELFADPKNQKTIIDRLIRDGAVSDIEVQMKRKDGGMLWISLSAVSVPGPGGAPEFFDGILADITARKTAEVALLEANQKLKLLNSLTRHDVRNQLMLLKGFVQLMAAKDPDPGISDYLKKIQRITETISSQIEFTKAYQELGLNTPCWHLLADMIEKTPTPVEVTISDACRQVEIYADLMLEQVFFNLFDNAFRHGQKATQIQVRCEHEGDQLRIMVEDDGVGIPAEHKEKIFKKGFGKHTGLGLFLTREILAITGITIRETGTPGNGARFELDVPKGMFRDVP